MKCWKSNHKSGEIIGENGFLIGNYKICVTANTANTKNQPDFDKPLGSECLNQTVDNYENEAVMEIKAKQPEKGKFTLSDLWNFTTTNKSKSKQKVEVYIKLQFNGGEMLEAFSRAFSIKPVKHRNLVFRGNKVSGITLKWSRSEILFLPQEISLRENIIFALP